MQRSGQERCVIKIDRIGKLARLALEQPGAWHVAAVFDRSLLLEAAGAFVVIGEKSIGNGPLNLICTEWPLVDWLANGLTEGQRVRVSSDAVLIDGGPVFDLAGSAIWSAPSWPIGWTADGLAAALRALTVAAQLRAPAEGLAALMFEIEDTGPTIRTPVARAALLGVATLEDWLAATLSGGEDAEVMAAAARGAVHGLMGLGPGLTPSGDDLLAGLALALHATGALDAVQQLAAFVDTAPADATSAYSRALFATALDGHSSETMYRVLSKLLEGKLHELPSCLDLLDRVGHTSGWDLLAGALLGLAAVAGAKG